MRHNFISTRYHTYVQWPSCPYFCRISFSFNETLLPNNKQKKNCVVVQFEKIEVSMIVSSGEFLFVKLCTHFNRSEIVSQKKLHFY